MSEPSPSPPTDAHADLAAAPLRRPARCEPPEPYAGADIARALRNPLLAIDIALASPSRVGANVAQRVALAQLALVFVFGGVLFALPYGCLLGAHAWWRIVALYLGSTSICLPSLHVFASYLGQRVTLTQILVLALSAPAVAAAFTLGFAPIVGFLRATMSPDETQISWRVLSSSLLGIALGAGVLQSWRCAYGARLFSGGLLLPLAMLVWHGVFLYVFVRMFRVLDL